MTPFPLLQLPLVAIKHVLCMMNPFELIDVSLTSSRAKKCVKSISKTKMKFLVAFDNSDPSITFHKELKSWKFAIKMNESQARKYKSWQGLLKLHTQEDTELFVQMSEEPLKDIMKWFDHVKEVLNCKIDSVTFYLCSNSNENRETIDWIAAQGKTIDDLKIPNNYGEQSDDDLEYLMESIHVSGTLSLMIKSYKYGFQMEIPGKPKLLHILYSTFIDYEQLLRLKSPVIILSHSILTNEKIKRFLRSWVSCETHLELKAIQISISGPGAMNEIIDLPYAKTNDPKVVEVLKAEPFNLQVVNEMFTIRRNDGKKRATVTAARLWGTWSFYLIVH